MNFATACELGGVLCGGKMCTICSCPNKVRATEQVPSVPMGRIPDPRRGRSHAIRDLAVEGEVMSRPAVGGTASMQHRQSPLLTSIDGRRDEYNGETLMNDVFDLMRHGLPRLRLDDPVRPAVSALLPLLAEELGRPAVVAVPSSRLRDAADHR